MGLNFGKIFRFFSVIQVKIIPLMIRCYNMIVGFNIVNHTHTHTRTKYISVDFKILNSRKIKFQRKKNIRIPLIYIIRFCWPNFQFLFFSGNEKKTKKTKTKTKQKKICQMMMNKSMNNNRETVENEKRKFQFSFSP